ncbi:hypothetical protein VIGAN_02014900 [Vigna angularis var. angularis]|uniref:Uncharacterized protein n=1 Tax=Vigna angularis var. angularis TaxID=157739 RepID=A0A0S3RAI4_PHAAN|nr:hypothetical protein VIGAN_02014900 [Vigna angularis var. angularis]
MGVGEEGVFSFGGYGFLVTGDGELVGGFLYVGVGGRGSLWTGRTGGGRGSIGWSSLGGKGNSGCLKKCQKKAEVQIADENLSFPAAGLRVCVSSDTDSVTIFEFPCEGHGSADALCS